MATITFGKALGDWGWLEDYVDEKTLKLVSKSATKVIYRDGDGDRIVLTGKQFSFAGDFATKGTVTGVDFITKSGEKYLTFTHGAYKAADVFAEIKNKELFNLFSVLTAGNDTINGSGKADDMIIGRNAGNDRILGKGGDDFIKGSAGDNYMDGGAGGWDVLSYQETRWDTKNAKKGAFIDIAKGKVHNPWGGTDTIKNFEEYRGSHRADTFKGGSKDDVFVGLQGADRFIGGKGQDELRYHWDRESGGKKGIVADLQKGTIKDGFGYVDTVKSIERVYGTYFNDSFKGDKADNLFRGLKGKDSFDGRGGSDTVSFYWWEDLGQKGVVVDLRKTTGNILNDGFGNKETAKSIENIEGSQFADNITLGKADGWSYGNDGNDRLVAGSGQNWLGGGKGKDTFVFLSAKDSTAKKTDVIEDFSRKQGDRIDVSKVADFDFIGKAKFSGKGAELSYKVKSGDTFVYGDTNGDGKTDFVFKLEGKFTLLESDFIL